MSQLPSSPSSSSNDYVDKSNPGRWTRREDELLRLGVQQCGARNWKKISKEYLNETRTDIQCLHRWTKVRLHAAAAVL